ncbi:hypothetical protein [Vibrio sp. CyArs1]|uniref:hypothetical protein n=1 Tax=Vibrio sp. CyArs1 TaxID=2682577 RepID=UPI001F06115B|nr:hypothetical protein [Vibrio sp. CyArs1]
MKTIRISLSAINPEDKRYQVRDPRASTFGEKVDQEKTSRRHIKAIVKALTDDPNLRIELIEVVEDPNKTGQYIIVDGFHRYAAFSQINTKSKGKLRKQIRVKVHTEGVPIERALSINTEHNALPLTSSQRVELQWQQFLVYNLQEDKPSIKQTAELLGVQTSTVSNWRKLHKEFESEGFFEKGHNVAKSSLTGYPMLKPSRDELKRCSDFTTVDETDGGLLDADKELALEILKKARASKEPDKLYTFIQHYWGNSIEHIDLDISLEELETDF